MIIQRFIKKAEIFDNEVIYQLSSIHETTSPIDEYDVEIPSYAKTADLWERLKFTESDFKMMFSHSGITEFKKGKTIIKAGELNSRCYLITKGTVKIISPGSITLMTQNEGIFGIESLVLSDELYVMGFFLNNF